MKFRKAEQSTEEMFKEFDLWITPTLVEITDTQKYLEELKNTQFLLELIGNETLNFSNLNLLDIRAIVDAVLKNANTRELTDRIQIIDNTASLLFLVTGKSDNNAKCQFPLFLRDISHWEKIPSMSGNKLKRKDIPRTIKSSQISKNLAKLKPETVIQREFFTEYVKFILDKPEYVRSFWSIGNSYYKMKSLGLQKEFLMPLVIFKVRGSVSASGGHEPEELLREIMTSWGLVAGIDFNESDVIVHKDSTNSKSKTRAFDFVLPYKVDGWANHIYIQCQFYAGDSGSVSHKNVDQTRSSRDSTKAAIQNPKPMFIEYLDGAGYFSSLNRDLYSILSMEDTTDFFQVRTAPLKLRRALQNIGYLIPLEFVHILALNYFDLEKAKFFLKKDGYQENEINRVLQDCIHRNLFFPKEDIIEVEDKFLETCRKYYLLDVIFNYSQPIESKEEGYGVILTPMQKGIWGISLSSIGKFLKENGGAFSDYYTASKNLLEDLEFLAKKRWIVQN